MVAHGHKQIVLVQHLVVLKVVQQRIGHRAHFRRQKDSRTLNPHRRAYKYGLQKAGQINGVGSEFFVQQVSAVLPSQHQRKDAATDQQRKPAPVKQLEQIRRPERKVHDEEETGGANAQRQGVFPAVTKNVERQDGGDQHVGTNCNAVGCCQVAGRLEHHHRRHDKGKQTPVDKGQVDLAGVFDAGVQNLQAWQVPQLYHLLGDRERTRDQCLRGNDSSHGRQRHEWDQGPVWRHHKKRVFHSQRVLQ